MDLTNEIQALKKQIASLESQRNVLFGSSYTNTGSTSSDYLIKTRGKVKIQIGNKFLDLLKDGKLNVDSKFIFKQDSVGVKDGIYIIGDGEDAKVIISIGGSQIDLKGEIGTTYVSFQGNQETTSEQKHSALQNIGFLYKTIEQVQNNGLQSGIVYIESNQKLYIVQNGSLTEYTFEIPNPYPKQFVIAKSDSNKGALVIRGSGINNALSFDSMDIYSEELDNYIDSQGNIYIRIDDTQKVLIGQSETVFSNSVVSQKFSSISATSDSGFRLYVDNGESTLEVDNLVVRNNSSSTNYSLYPQYWYRENNIISTANFVSKQDTINITLNLSFTNTFQVNDSLYVYTYLKKEGNDFQVLLPFIVTSIEDNSIKVTLQEELLKDKIDKNYLLDALKLQTIFLAGRETGVSLLRRNQQSIDLIHSTSFTDEQDTKSITSRFGNIEELNLSGIVDQKEIIIKGNGVYSDNGCFLKAQYISSYDLPVSDNSTQFISTEWFHKILPKGSIIMFNGQLSEIPEGWHICDGTNGTPNLIDKFIKASTSSGLEGGYSDIEIKKENMPTHTHTFTNETIETTVSGKHSHTYTIYGDLSDASDHGDGWYEVSKTDDERITSESGEHTHSIDTSQMVLSQEGEGKPIEWQPVFYSLIFIMKLI